MVNHRIKLTDNHPQNHSFSHQQSINHNESKHKKKGSLYIRNDRTPNYTRLKTDQKEVSYGYRQEQVNSYGGSLHLGHSNHSATKISRGKQKNSVGVEKKKTKKSKNTVSVIHLSKNHEEPRHKGSVTVTKRKQSNVDFSDRIRDKIQDFRVIASCLDQYTKEERRNKSDVNFGEIIKIISAFNRSEIAPISKPLEKLISEIVGSIQNSLPVKDSHQKSVSFDSPEKANQEHDQIKNTVKKPNSKEFAVKKEEEGGQVSKLQQNLGRLKYESNRLKYFLEQIGSNRSNEKKYQDDYSKVRRQKLSQLQKLQEVAQEQTKVIKQLQNSEEQNTFRDDRHY